MSRIPPEKMRVVMFGSLPPIRGISAYCTELARALAPLTRLTFVSFKAIYPRFLYPGGNLNDNSQPVPDQQGFVVRRTLSWYNPLGWAWEAVRTDATVAHVQHWTLPLTPIWFIMLLIFKVRGIKTILTIHNVGAHEKSGLYLSATRLLSRLADRCIVHSESNRRRAVEFLRLPERKLTVIRHGVLHKMNITPADRAEARSRLALQQDAPTALFFGSIRPYKGLRTLLQAFRQVVEKLPQARLIIAGAPWNGCAEELDAIENSGLREHIVQVLRYIPAEEVASLFAAADLCVLPYTHFDAQSGAALTAIAFDKPLIVTKTGGLPELVSDGRFITPPRDADALAAAMLTALSDARQLERMKQDAALTAMKHRWDEIALHTVDLYKDVG